MGPNFDPGTRRNSKKIFLLLLLMSGSKFGPVPISCKWKSSFNHILSGEGVGWGGGWGGIGTGGIRF